MAAAMVWLPLLFNIIELHKHMEVGTVRRGPNHFSTEATGTAYDILLLGGQVDKLLEEGMNQFNFEGEDIMYQIQAFIYNCLAPHQLLRTIKSV